MTRIMEPQVTDRVRSYWERSSCGTNRASSQKHSRDYFEEIEEFRYRHEGYIHSFVQFTRWHGKRVLEVGVGAATDFVQFARAGAIVSGVDLTEESIANARARLEVYGLPAADLRVANAESLPYDDESFDLAYSWGVIHHADDMERVFAEMYRVTRPGGWLKIMVYNVESMHAWYMYLRHALLKGKPFRGRRWAIYNYQESYATKAYRRSEIAALASRFPHTDFRCQLWDQSIRRGARYERFRTWLQRCTPESMRWYLAFEMRKEG